VFTPEFEAWELVAFFSFLIEYMTSGPVIALELLAENGMAKWRELLGPTDSEQARKDAPGSIRARFGKDKSLNAAHGSDSCISAERVCTPFMWVQSLVS
jgi:nucleoside-diphosphate kinase